MNRTAAFIGIFIGALHLQVFSQNYPKQEIDMDKFVQDLFGQQSGEARYDDVFENVFQYYRSPLDLNIASREELQNLYILSEYQINSLLNYIKKNGKLLTIYELQAVPGFDRNTLDKIMPFVKVQDDGLSSDARTLLNRIRREENNYLITRYQRTAELYKGFKVADTLQNQAFLGSPDKYYARYRVYQKNDFSIGFTLEKDAGEQIAWNPAQKQYGMDFYSGHFAVFNKGRLKAFTLGDYQVQIGQGLVMSAGFYIGKGAETVTTTRRSNQGIRPYSSAMESGFLRGIAATLNFGRFDWTNFYSYRNLDANLRSIGGDTSLNQEQFLATIYQSGYHRTASELNIKSRLNQQVAGTCLVYTSRNKNLKVAINTVYTFFGSPVKTTPRVYNQFNFSGTNNYNMGMDFTYNWQNFNVFGEYSRSGNGGSGLITGFVSSLHPKVDFTMLYRSYDRNFYSFYGNSFGELTTSRNERGLYWGLKILPSRKIVFAAYYDKFSFPWLTYRSDAPAEGWGYLLRLDYKPTKKITLYAQLREETKQINQADNETKIDYISDARTRNYLINLDYHAEKIVSLKSRVQFTEYKQEGRPSENGFVIFQDVNFDINKRIKISTRFAVFDAQSYNSRIYVYEKNVLWAFAMPVYYGQGVRDYIMIQYKFNKNLDIWLRVARFEYKNQDKISSGVNEIEGNSKTDITVQVKYDF